MLSWLDGITGGDKSDEEGATKVVPVAKQQAVSQHNSSHKPSVKDGMKSASRDGEDSDEEAWEHDVNNSVRPSAGHQPSQSTNNTLSKTREMRETREMSETREMREMREMKQNAPAQVVMRRQESAVVPTVRSESIHLPGMETIFNRQLKVSHIFSNTSFVRIRFKDSSCCGIVIIKDDQDDIIAKGFRNPFGSLDFRSRDAASDFYIQQNLILGPERLITDRDGKEIGNICHPSMADRICQSPDEQQMIKALNRFDRERFIVRKPTTDQPAILCRMVGSNSGYIPPWSETVFPVYTKSDICKDVVANITVITGPYLCSPGVTLTEAVITLPPKLSFTHACLLVSLGVCFFQELIGR